jgi:Holliday junction resolvase RusA-like endonuclease
MNLPLSFSVPITPVAKGRPRFGHGHVFTPPETILFEQAFVAMSRKFKPAEPLECPLDVDIRFHFIRPVSSKRIFHTVKPDNDNLIKAVCDSMNNIFWRDDAQIVRVTATKFYSDKSRIDIEIKEWKGLTE